VTITRFAFLFVLVLLPAAWAQTPQRPPDAPPPLFKNPPKEFDPNGRTLEGTVKDEQENNVEGAVVKLKNKKSLQVVSYITRGDGKFRFTQLRKDVDYEVQADHKNTASTARTLSVFDERKNIIMTLKLEPKK
jgi:hypothetical protein